MVAHRRASCFCPSDKQSAPPRSDVISANRSRKRRDQAVSPTGRTWSRRPLLTADRVRDGRGAASGRVLDIFDLSLVHYSSDADETPAFCRFSWVFTGLRFRRSPALSDPTGVDRKSEIRGNFLSVRGRLSAKTIRPIKITDWTWGGRK